MTGRHALRGAVLGLGLALITAFAVGCAPSAPVHVENATDIAVGVYADGRWVGTYAPGTSGDASISSQGRPQILEVRSPSGAVLLSLPINDDQLAGGAAGGYGNGASVGLSCGVVTVLIGRLEANEALAPAKAVEPGPCP